MTGIFQYSVLKYVHSFLLEEELNVALLIYIPQDKTLKFLYPDNLSRLKHVYRDFPEREIKNYFKNFTYAAHSLGKQPNLIFSDRELSNIIKDKFIPSGAYSLVFSEVKAGTLYANSEKVIDSIYKKYFSHYNSTPKNHQRKDEKYVLNKFIAEVKHTDESVLTYLKGETEIKSDRGLIKFDKHWQNHTENYVKAIGFDLQDGNDIISKANTLFGSVHFIAKERDLSNKRLDLIISKPSNQKLLVDYRNAKDILAQADAHVNIIEEDRIEDYSRRISAEVVRGISDL